MKNLFGKSLFVRNLIFVLAFGVFLFAILTSACSGTQNTGENSNVGGARQTGLNANAVTNTVTAANSANVTPAAGSSAPTNVNSAKPENSPASMRNDSTSLETDPEMPTDGEIQTLIKTTLLDFNSAIQSGSFDSFHSSASGYFQQQHTPGQLEQRYADLIKRKVNLADIANKQAIVTPRLEDQNGIKVLIANGNYATNPPLNFELEYIQEDIEWKLLSIEFK